MILDFRYIILCNNCNFRRRIDGCLEYPAIIRLAIKDFFPFMAQMIKPSISRSPFAIYVTLNDSDKSVRAMGSPSIIRYVILTKSGREAKPVPAPHSCRRDSIKLHSPAVPNECRR